MIATPGRLNDLVQAKVIDVSSVTYLVLDEVSTKSKQHSTQIYYFLKKNVS